jgi:Zn-dependent membrane protease YugP
MFFDPLNLVLILPALALSLWASWRTNAAFKKYSRVRSLSGLTGAQAAQRLLAGAGISDVDVVATRGTLSDHYNPATKTLALSEPVFGSPSVAAIGVACHEAGHAIQHARGYKPLWLRSALVPTANIGSKLGYFVMFAGLLLMYMASFRLGQQVVLFGALLFSAVLLFQIVTLPVEFDATRRAKRGAGDHRRAGAAGDGPGAQRRRHDLRRRGGGHPDDPHLLSAAGRSSRRQPRLTPPVPAGGPSRRPSGGFGAGSGYRFRQLVILLPRGPWDRPPIAF